MMHLVNWLLEDEQQAWAIDRWRLVGFALAAMDCFIGGNEDALDFTNMGEELAARNDQRNNTACLYTSRFPGTNGLFNGFKEWERWCKNNGVAEIKALKEQWSFY